MKNLLMFVLGALAVLVVSFFYVQFLDEDEVMVVQSTETATEVDADYVTLNELQEILLVTDLKSRMPSYLTFDQGKEYNGGHFNVAIQMAEAGFRQMDEAPDLDKLFVEKRVELEIENGKYILWEDMNDKDILLYINYVGQIRRDTYVMGDETQVDLWYGPF
jgi:hypothetical protein